MIVKRFCAACGKSYDFEFKSTKELENLTCPVCGGHVGRESREHPEEEIQEKKESGIGSIYRGFCRFAYLFYFVLSAAGIIAFFVKFYPLLYAVTGICVGVFLLQLVFGYCTFPSGLILVPVGVVAGFLITKSLAGACLGAMVVFCVRHLARDIIYTLIFRLIHAGNRQEKKK